MALSLVLLSLIIAILHNLLIIESSKIMHRGGVWPGTKANSYSSGTPPEKSSNRNETPPIFVTPIWEKVSCKFNLLY